MPSKTVEFNNSSFIFQVHLTSEGRISCNCCCIITIENGICVRLSQGLMACYFL